MDGTAFCRSAGRNPDRLWLVRAFPGAFPRMRVTTLFRQGAVAQPAQPMPTALAQEPAVVRSNSATPARPGKTSTLKKRGSTELAKAASPRTSDQRPGTRTGRGNVGSCSGQGEGCDRDADGGCGHARTQRREARNAKEHAWTPRGYDLRARERKKRVRRRDWREAVSVSREGG